jgi:uncharacterized membrane protein YcaP (DUF421 family)
MILILFRLTGKRDLATVNVFDFIVLFLLSNVMPTAIIERGNSPGRNHRRDRSGRRQRGAEQVACRQRAAARVLGVKPTTTIEKGRFLLARPGGCHCDPSTQSSHPGAERRRCHAGLTGVMEPNGQLVLTLKKEEQSVGKIGIAGLNAQLKAMQASPELLAACR